MKKFSGSTKIRSAMATLAALSIINASLLGPGGSAWGDTDHVAESIQVVDATHVVGGQAAEDVYLCIGLAGLSFVMPLALIFAVPVCGGVLLGTLG